MEGADLTVRDRRVYLKTVEGLQQVDVILRRVDDSFCDPLELRGDSFLGVPGLVDAVVAGNVKVANALGSGVIETAAIMPFLPGLSRHLLGEQLKLPSVATWWCGQDYALDWVLDIWIRWWSSRHFRRAAWNLSSAPQLAQAEKQKLARPAARAALRVCGAGTGRAVDRPGLGQRTPATRAAWCCEPMC